MKNEVPINQASRLINCGTVILITASAGDKTTITPCAWHMPISKNPSLLGVALAKGHFSSELIQQSKEFVVNIPRWNLLEKVMVCGKFSGREGDKFKRTQLTKVSPNRLKQAPYIYECVGHIECRLFEIKEVGDHFLFIGNVEYSQAENEYFKEGFWDTNKVELIFHLGAKYFFKSSPYVEVGI